MKPQQLWTGVVGFVFMCVGIAIVGAVAYFLYPPGSSQPSSQEATVFSCSGMPVVVLVSDGEARLSFADGRIFDVTQVSSSADPDAEGEMWTRYVSADGSFVFWSTGQRALIEEDGIVTGECFAKAN